MTIMVGPGRPFLIAPGHGSLGCDLANQNGGFGVGEVRDVADGDSDVGHGCIHGRLIGKHECRDEVITSGNARSARNALGDE